MRLSCFFKKKAREGVGGEDGGGDVHFVRDEGKIGGHWGRDERLYLPSGRKPKCTRIVAAFRLKSRLHSPP